jgi:hypothetical protein
MLIGQAIGQNLFSILRNPAKHRPVRDPAEFTPKFPCSHEAGAFLCTTAAFNLEPTGLDLNPNLGTILLNVDPISSVLGLATTIIEADNLAAARTSSKADEEYSTVAKSLGCDGAAGSPWP